MPSSRRGPNKGFDTTYAPDYQFKIGGIYRYKEDVKVGLIGNLVDDSFADANNTRSHFIPAYTVWDLTAEVKFFNGRARCFRRDSATYSTRISTPRFATKASSRPIAEIITAASASNSKPSKRTTRQAVATGVKVATACAS